MKLKQSHIEILWDLEKLSENFAQPYNLQIVIFVISSDVYLYLKGGVVACDVVGGVMSNWIFSIILQFPIWNGFMWWGWLPVNNWHLAGVIFAVK